MWNTEVIKCSEEWWGQYAMPSRNDYNQSTQCSLTRLCKKRVCVQKRWDELKQTRAFISGFLCIAKHMSQASSGVGRNGTVLGCNTEQLWLVWAQITFIKSFQEKNYFSFKWNAMLDSALAYS